jgi:hypothetical protein
VFTQKPYIALVIVVETAAVLGRAQTASIAGLIARPTPLMAIVIDTAIGRNAPETDSSNILYGDAYLFGVLL